MFCVGDVITGTPENDYAITKRGVICKVIGTYVSGRITVEVIGVDEELLDEANFDRYDRYVGKTYIVLEKHFEYYGSQTKFIDSSSELIDFIDGM